MVFKVCMQVLIVFECVFSDVLVVFECFFLAMVFECFF